MDKYFKKNIDTLGNEQAPFYYRKYNIRQKLVFLKLVSMSPELFQPLIETSKP